MSVLLDSYSETNKDFDGEIASGATQGTGIAQSFTPGQTAAIYSAKFYLKKTGTPTGNATAKLYAHSGTYGTSSVPGSLLATSANLDVSTLTGSYQVIELLFSTYQLLTSGTRYVIAIEYSGGSSSNKVNVGVDVSSPSHGGNISDKGSGSYVAESTVDCCFYVYGIDNITVSPSVASAVFSIPTPTVTAVQNVTVSPSVLSATFSLPSPSVSTGGASSVTVSPSVLSLLFSIQAPFVITASSVSTTRFFPKFFVYKIYDSDGNFLTTWSDDVISTPRFTTGINAGPGEMIVRLEREFENFGEDEDVTFDNRVDCWCHDMDNPSQGILLYRGFISTYAPILTEGRQFIQITLLPYISRSSKIMLRESSGATTVPFLSKDPADIFRGIITRAVADGLRIETTPTSIDNTSTTVSYTFNTNTVKEGFDKGIELAPDGWYWRVDPDNTFHLHEKPSGVTHDLLIGQHIQTMQPEKRIEGIINRVYVTGGGDPPLFEVYSRASSISAYGLRAVKLIDQRVTSSLTAQTLATRILDESESPEVRTRLVIIDNNGNRQRQGYDIESIKVGDTVRIKNLQFGQKSETLWDNGEWDVDVWDQTLASIAGSPLLVVKTSYSGGNVLEIETSSRFPVVSKRIEDINRNLQNSQTVNNPSSPS